MPQPDPLPQRAWAVTALVVVFMMLNFADRAVLGFAAVPLMHELAISTTTFGLIASSFFLLFQVSSVVVGFMADRISGRWLLFGLAAAWTLAQLPVVLAASVPALVANRVLLGASEGPAAPVAMHALHGWFPPQRRGLPSSLHLTGAALGVLVAAPALTWVIHAHGWRSAFLALAACSGTWALLWLAVGRESPSALDARVACAQRHPDGGHYVGVPPLFVPYRRIFRTGTFAGGTAAAFGAYWAVAVSSAWLPAYLQTERSLRPGTVAAVIMAIAGTSIVLVLTVVPKATKAMASGRDGADRWGALSGVAVTLAGAAMLVLPTTTGAVSAVAMVLAFSVGTLAYPWHYLTVAAIVPAAQRAGVFGTMVALTTSAGFLAPAVTGWIVAEHGFPTAFIVAGLLMVAGGLVGTVAVRAQRDATRLGL
jgi:MFS family permease